LTVNSEVAALFVDALARSELRHVCISPGSRSGPLAVAFARHPRLRTWVHVDERSSGFFALGLAKRSGDPVAVLTTSGTAAAELHPAVLEAYHSQTPLVVLTADRPPELRDRGANQTVDQARLYGGATRWTFDPGPPDPATPPRFWNNLAARALSIARGPVAGPVHINFPFREPLLSDDADMHSGQNDAPPFLRLHESQRTPNEDSLRALALLIASAQRPFLHAGSLPPDERVAAALSDLSSRTNIIIHAEPTSNLRRAGIRGLVCSTEALLRDEHFARTHAPDLVIRLGAAPTSRVLGEWLVSSAPANVLLVDPDAAWADPDSLATEAVHSDTALALEGLAGRMQAARSNAWHREWLEADQRARAAIDTELDGTPLFEAHAVRTLAARLPRDATLLVGSSMAVRDVDWFWGTDTRRFIANRGASGIDGFVSTAIGAAAASAGEPTVALCGDLTLYHDMNGLLAARKYEIPTTFVVLNNDGGGIFSYLGESRQSDVFEDVFATPTGLDLQRVASLYGCAYERVDDSESLARATGERGANRGCAIIDVRFSRADSVSGHRRLWAAASSAIHEAHRAARGT
jgi:2-succinyl-5-enolpyruvyl-6-hydroxy-3-cyclohexene-1-carboxylate synthase